MIGIKELIHRDTARDVGKGRAVTAYTASGVCPMLDHATGGTFAPNRSDPRNKFAGEYGLHI